MTDSSPGRRLRAAVTDDPPLQVVGTINALAARMAERAGFRALYLSGAGVANASLGLPDLGLTTLDDVCIDVRRIAGATRLPLLVDADTGWGNALMIERAVAELARAGAAGCHIEDQVAAKRCGHRPGKALVATEEMCARVAAAVGGRPDDDFVIMARTDAHAREGLDAAVARARAYVDAGADMVFAEAPTSLDEVRAFTGALDVPVLVNLTEFGRTPLFTRAQMADAGAGLLLYPLSAFRAMNAAAERVYATLRDDGAQHAVVDAMQTREALYELLGYHDYERRLDRLLDDGDDEEGD